MEQTEGRVTFVYRFSSENTPPIGMRLKVETNTREHFAVHGFKTIPFGVSSRWFEGQCKISTYELDELLATKMRALYQRKKSRDLFDLATALEKTDVEPGRIVELSLPTWSMEDIESHERYTNKTFRGNFLIHCSQQTSAHCWQTIILGI